MSIGTIITYIMLFFSLIGAADRAIGCRFGPGKAFEKGFGATGAIMLAMIGPFAIAPLISALLAPVLQPICEAAGIDPSVIAGVFMANDSGGWHLAMELAQDEQIGRFTGSIMGSTMGTALMFSFPVSFVMVSKEKHPQAALGLTIGIIALPVTNLIGGLCFGIGILPLLRNLLPLLILSAVFIIGLVFFRQITVKIITGFGYVLTAFLTVALAASMVIKVMNLDVEIIGSFDECLLIIGSIVIFLSGAFTLLYFLQTYCGRFFRWIGARLHMREISVIGLVTTAINAIPMFTMTDDMDDRGVTVNIAFLVPAGFLFGDHLAFQAAVDPSTAMPFIVGKAAGGILAIVLAMLVTSEKNKANH